jgi:hypothetical protein
MTSLSGVLILSQKVALRCRVRIKTSKSQESPTFLCPQERCDRLRQPKTISIANEGSKKINDMIEHYTPFLN